MGGVHWKIEVERDATYDWFTGFLSVFRHCFGKHVDKGVGVWSEFLYAGEFSHEEDSNILDDWIYRLRKPNQAR